MEQQVKTRKWKKDIPLTKADTFQPTKEEALGQIALQLAETTDNKILTDLDSRMINSLTILMSISEQFDLETYNTICTTLLRLRVSNKRLGRKELLEIARAVREEPERKLSRLRRFLGLGL